MSDATVLRALSRVFGPTSRGDWDDLAGHERWRAFLDGTASLIGASRSWPHLVDALATPPCFAEHSAFAFKCFVGGLPSSALPVESLYRADEGVDGPRYLQKPAAYMSQLIESLGLEVPPAFKAAPDHLSLELEVAALYLELGLDKQAWQLLHERTSWLPSYRERLVEIPVPASFYLACVDVIVEIVRAREGGSDR